MNKKETKQGTILVKYGKIYTRVETSEIRYIKAFMGGVKVYLENGKELLSDSSITKISKAFKKYGFFCISHTYMVNLRQILRYKKGKRQLMMGTDDKIIVARENKEAFWNEWSKMFDHIL